MNDEQLALLIDPKRERAGWWVRHSPKCPDGHDIPSGRSLSSRPYKCNKCAVHLHDTSVTWETDYTGPPLTTDRVAAFTYIGPILEAAGLLVEQYPWGTYVRIDTTENDPEIPWASWECISGSENDEGCAIPYPAATTAALAWLNEHEPERLRKAVEGINHD